MGSRGASAGSGKVSSVAEAPTIKGYTRFSKEVLLGPNNKPEAALYFYEATGESKGDRDHIVVYVDGPKGISRRWYSETSGPAYDKAFDAFLRVHPENDMTRM